MDIVTYALCKKLVAGVASGISSYRIEDNSLIIVTTDGQTLTMNFPTPKDGVSVIGVEIDANNHLICTMSDGSTIDAGKVVGGSSNGGNVDVNLDYATTKDIDGLFEDLDYATTNEVETMFNENIKEEVL